MKRNVTKRKKHYEFIKQLEEKMKVHKELLADYQEDHECLQQQHKQYLEYQRRCVS